MKTLIINLFGLDKEIFENLSSREKRQFSSALIAFFISVFTSSIIAAEMSVKVFGGFSYWMFAIMLVWCILVGFLEVLLLRGDAHPVFRLFFSIGLVLLTVTTTFTWLVRDDVEQTKTISSRTELNRIDSLYEAEKSARYSSLNERKTAQRLYHDSICIPEALNLHAGPIYNKKHAFCLNELDEIAHTQSELDSAEINYYGIYQEQRSFISNEVSPGFFRELRLVFDFISHDWLKLTFFFVMAIVLLCIESIVFFTAIKRHRNQEYNFLADLKSKLLQSEIETKINSEHIMRRQQAELELLRIEDEIILKKEYQKHSIALQDLRLQNSIVIGRNAAFQKGRINPKVLPQLDSFIDKKVLRDYSSPFIEVKEEPKVKTNIEVGKTEKYIDIKTDIFNKDVKATTFFSNLFYCSLPMKQLCDRIFSEANGDPIKYTKAIFDWCRENIEYKKQQSGYKTARETFNVRSGVCGEMAVLYIALLRYKGLKCDYVRVSEDYKGNKVNHACGGITVEGKFQLVDIAYKEYGISHQKWEIRSENELYRNYRAWNQ